MFNENIPPFGGWDGTGCTTVLTGPVSTICECFKFGTYAVLAEMIEPPGYPEEWEWLEIVANVGYGLSILSLLLFTLGIVFKRTLLTDMFYILRLSFAVSYLVGLTSMWVADLTTETILEDHVMETRPNGDDYLIETRPNNDDYLMETRRNMPPPPSYKEESKFAGFIDVDYNNTNLVRAESRYKPRFKPLMSVQTRY